MKKFKIITVLIVALLLMTSCSIGGDRLIMFYRNSDKEEANNTFEEILISISEKDKNMLKNVFSDDALEEVDSFDDDIEYLFELFQGSVIKWEIITGPQVSETNDHGKKTKEIKTWYEIETEENYFVVFILEYTENTEQPENIGVYSLRIVEKENEDSYMTYWQDMIVPGIYRPDK